MKIYLEQDYYDDKEKNKAILKELKWVEVDFRKKRVLYDLYIKNKKGHYKFRGYHETSLDEIIVYRYSLIRLIKLILFKIFGGLT